MKYRIFSLLIILILAVQMFGTELNNREFRTAWVIIWNYMVSSTDTEASIEKNKARTREILDNMKAANMNAVLWQVRRAGEVYYHSDYEPWGIYTNNSYPGYDPLQYAIDEAHARGMELHAWFNTFATASLAKGAPAQKHPNWVCRDRDGNPMQENLCLSPGLAEVREYTRDVVLEIVNKYDIDGIHFDYVRWNEYTNSKTSREWARYVAEHDLPDGYVPPEEVIYDLTKNKSGRYLYDVEHPYSGGVPTGYSSWENYWRGSVNQFIELVADSVRQVKPWVKISAAALGRYKAGGTASWNGYYSVYQDAAKWFNEGWVNHLMPMHYHWTTGLTFSYALKTDWYPNIGTGLDAGYHYTAGPASYILLDYNAWSNHRGIVNDTRDLGWVDGFQFFSYGSWESYANSWEWARNNIFHQLVKPPVAEFMGYSAPADPVITLIQDDTTRYRIHVEPGTLDQPHWFAVYRQQSPNFDPDTSAIFQIVRSDSTFDIPLYFDPKMPHPDTWKFSVTSLNRAWMESGLSNVVETESLPMYPPAVTWHSIGENETQIPVHRNLLITFDYPVDPETFSSALSISPAADVVIDWQEDLKAVTILFPEQLQYGTPYQLRVEPSAVGLYNRIPLDGNRDGYGGDAFVLNFTTEPVDTEGPVVDTQGQWPRPGSTEITGFSVNGLISIPFNEIIDSSTVHQALTVTETPAGIPDTLDPPAVAWKVTTANHRSVLTLKSYTEFIPDCEYTISLSQDLKDAEGNALSEPFEMTFTTQNRHLADSRYIDRMFARGTWNNPQMSSYTYGINESVTNFWYTEEFFVPGQTPEKSGYLTYMWNPDTTDGFLSVELVDGVPAIRTLDSTKTLHVFVYSDGSENLFRLCLKEMTGGVLAGLEVSNWDTLNWLGWKLFEWPLNDPAAVGTWAEGGGDGILNGDEYLIHSFQLKRTPESALYGTIGVDNFYQVVYGDGRLTAIENPVQVPLDYALGNNYPNPFNPVTTIPFTIARDGRVSLNVLDVTGRRVAVIHEGFITAGHHSVDFNASHLASGIYVLRLQADGVQRIQKMVLMK
ncbi:MAG: family 10 glycosylhydrolase [Fidelibacterota bacterium]